MTVTTAVAAPRAERRATPTREPLGDRLTRAATAIDGERQRLRIPGLALAIVEKDRVVLMRGFGVRNVEADEPVDSGTVFPIGSCTKAFTAMAAIICQEQGKLSLDDHPKRYLSWFRLRDPEADAIVTIRDMLSHRVGLRAYADLAAEPGVLTREEYLRAATAAKPVARLRERFQYSNAMVVAAGEIVGKVQNTTWERAVEKLLFRPLGMTSTVASLDDLARLPNHATGYDDPEGHGHWKPVPPPASVHALAPAGAIAASASDMTRWIRFMLGEGMLDGRRITSAAGVREAITPHMDINPSLSYGLGWALYDSNGHRVVEHNGGSSGISAVVSMMPEREMGFVILMNASPNSLNAVGHAGKILWPILLGEPSRTGSVPTPSRTPPPAAADSASADTVGLPAVDDLLTRMIRAAGGERNLGRPRSLELRCTRRYLNQGVDAEQRIRRQAPGRLEMIERWTASGRFIGSVRTYCDGHRAAQETTFGQDKEYSGESLEDAKRDAAFAWLLDARRAFTQIEVRGRIHRGQDRFLEVVASPSVGTPETWLVSERTFLMVEWKRGSTVESLEDFRNVDGWVIPFRTLVTDDLGESEVRVREVSFGQAVPEEAFEPHKPGPIRVPGD